MIKAIIVEDEAVAARRLTAMLVAENINVIDVFSSNKELQTYLSGTPEAELYLMDIHLNDGAVFETLQTLELKTPIIFTTAFDEFAIKAFKQNSVDYLLKPIGKEELKIAINKFKSVHQNKSSLDLNMLNQIISQQKPIEYRQRIKIIIGDKIKSMKMEDVVLVYSEQKTTFLHLQNSRSYPFDMSVEALFSELDPATFQRVNRAQVVNINFIQEVISYSNSRLKVILKAVEGQEVIVARERVKTFKDWLG